MIRAFKRHRVSYDAHFPKNRLLLTTKLTTFSRKRALVFFSFLRVGATVRVAATIFDKHDELRYSEWRFGDQWETSFVIVRFWRMLQTSCMVHWDDAEIREVDFEHIELHGNDLRAAETLMNH